MSMLFKGYIAASADGYIAAKNGSVEFLNDFQNIDCGYDEFICDVDIFIMGRKTYEVITSFGVGNGHIRTQKDLLSRLKKI